MRTFDHTVEEYLRELKHEALKDLSVVALTRMRFPSLRFTAEMYRAWKRGDTSRVAKLRMIGVDEDSVLPLIYQTRMTSPIKFQGRGQVKRKWALRMVVVRRIQTPYRRRLRLWKQFTMMSVAACEIERVFRGFIGRRQTLKWRRAMNSSTLICAMWRGCATRREYSKLLAYRRAAAVQIQRIYRGRLGRYLFSNRLRESVGLRMDVVLMRRWEFENEELLRATVRIQTTFRGRLARKAADERARQLAFDAHAAEVERQLGSLAQRDARVKEYERFQKELAREEAQKQSERDAETLKHQHHLVRLRRWKHEHMLADDADAMNGAKATAKREKDFSEKWDAYSKQKVDLRRERVGMAIEGRDISPVDWAATAEDRRTHRRELKTIHKEVLLKYNGMVKKAKKFHKSKPFWKRGPFKPDKNALYNDAVAQVTELKLEDVRREVEELRSAEWEMISAEAERARVVKATLVAKSDQRAILRLTGMVQRRARCWLARRELRRRVLLVYRKERDPVTRQAYYRNTHTGFVTFTRPRCLYQDLPVVDLEGEESILDKAKDQLRRRHEDEGARQQRGEQKRLQGARRQQRRRSSTAGRRRRSVREYKPEDGDEDRAPCSLCGRAASLRCTNCDEDCCQPCFLAAHRKGSRRKHNFKVFWCGACGKAESVVLCEACSENYCEACAAEAHRQGQRQQHQLKKLVCETCERYCAAVRCEKCREDQCLRCSSDHHRTGKRAQHKRKVFVCENCGASASVSYCGSCDESTCRACFSSAHASGNRRKHIPMDMWS